MRLVFGLLSGILGAVLGWFPIALLVINLTPDRDLGTVVMAFFVIGPIGGVIGFCVGLWLFKKRGLIHVPAGMQVSRPYAIAILAIAAGMALWSWVEYVRSP
jgi:hypothetical protein